LMPICRQAWMKAVTARQRETDRLAVAGTKR
jgi:hypothetical protein